MSTWHALLYPIKEGSEEIVKELFRNSGRPNFEIKSPDGQVVGRLLATMAFVGTGAAIRVIEVDGPLPVVAAHMSRQPEVREFERQLDRVPTEGVVELMCHPGHAPTQVISGYSSQREVELATFCSPSARAALEARGLHLESWSGV